MNLDSHYSLTRWIGCLAMVYSFWACSSPSKDQANKSASHKELSAQEVSENLIEQNRAVIEAEFKAIRAFVDSSGIAFDGLGNGMYVANVGAQGHGQIDTGQVVQVYSRIMNLYGDTYMDGIHQDIRVLRDNDAIWGLQEALVRAHVGDSLICVIPASLAHGVAGDFGDIPPLTSLVYYLRILH